MKTFLTFSSFNVLVFGLLKVSQLEAVPSYSIVDKLQLYVTSNPVFDKSNNLNNGKIYVEDTNNENGSLFKTDNPNNVQIITDNNSAIEVITPDNFNHNKPVKAPQLTTTDEDDGDLKRFTKAEYGLDIVKMLKLINDERAKYDAGPLRVNRRLMNACKQQSEYQARSRSMTHDGSGGSDFKQRCEKQGYFSSNGAENVAFDQDCEEDVIEAWINSPGHHANMINPIFTECGVSVKDRYWTQLFGCGNTEKDF